MDPLHGVAADVSDQGRPSLTNSCASSSKEETARKARIARALERGGMPGESLLAELERVLQDAHSLAEELAIDVKSVSESDDGSELPFEITFEQIGIVAVIASEISERAHELDTFADQLRSRIYHLDAIRREQARALARGPKVLDAGSSS
jgi:hypothetical protein